MQSPQDALYSGLSEHRGTRLTATRETPHSKPHMTGVSTRHATAFPSVTAALALCSIVLAGMAESAIGTAWIACATLDRNALMQGEIWRLWTGHFVHFSTQHALVNVLVFAITGSIVERYLGRTKFFIALAIGCAFISVGVMAWQSNLMEYRGLSAIGTALTVSGLFIIAKQHRAAFVYVALLGIFLGAKLLGEAFGVSSAAANLPAGVAVEWRAHVFGVFAGGLLILAMQVRAAILLKMTNIRASPADSST